MIFENLNEIKRKLDSEFEILETQKDYISSDLNLDDLNLDDLEL